MKAYIILLMSDGTLKGARTVSAIGMKTLAAFSTDVWFAASDLAGQALGNVGARAEDIARDLASRGVRAIWNDLRSRLKA